MNHINYEDAVEAAKRGCLLLSISRGKLLRMNKGKWEFIENGIWVEMFDGYFSKAGKFRIFHDPEDIGMATIELAEFERIQENSDKYEFPEYYSGGAGGGPTNYQRVKEAESIVERLNYDTSQKDREIEHLERQIVMLRQENDYLRVDLYNAKNQ